MADKKGTSGVKKDSGYISEEHIPSLRGSLWANIADEMTRSDDIVAAIETAIDNPILGSMFYAKEGDAGDSLSKELVEFIEWTLFTQMDRPFLDYVTEYLTIKKYGYYLVNPVPKVVNHPKYGPVTIIGDLSFRKPNSIVRWDTDENEQLIRVYQETEGADNQFSGWIDAKYLMHLALKRVGTNFEGESLYRPIYGNYFRKKLLQKIKIQSAERAGLGFPIIYYPPSLKEGSDQFKAIERAAANISSHKKSYMILPEGCKVDWGEIPAKISDIKDLIKDENENMTRRTMTDFIMLQAGSYAMIKDKTDRFIAPIEYIIYYWLDNIIDVIIKWIVNWNFPNAKDEHMPTMWVSGIEKKALTEFTTLVKTLIDAKVLTPDYTLEKFVRDYCNLPEPDAKKKVITDAKVNNPPEDVKQNNNDTKKPEEEEKMAEKVVRKFDSKANYAEIELDLTSMSKEFNNNETNNVSRIIEKYLVDIRKQFINENKSIFDILENTKLGYTNEFKSDVIRNIKKAVLSGKNRVDLMLKKDKSYAEGYRLAPSIFAWITSQAQKILDNKTSDIMKTARNAGMSKASFYPMSKELDMYTKGTILAAIEGALKDYAEKENVMDGNSITNMAYNLGIKDTATTDNEIVGFEYSAELDGGTTELCRELDGQTRAIDDDKSAELDPPNHFGCRSILIPITRAEQLASGIEFTGFHLKSSLAKAQWQF